MTRYHVVLPAPHSKPGSYLVGHQTPGLRGCYTADLECTTLDAAVAAAMKMNDERDCGFGRRATDAALRPGVQA